MCACVCLHWLWDSALSTERMDEQRENATLIFLLVCRKKGRREREMEKKTHENETERNETEWEMPVWNVTLNSFNKILHGIDSDIYG